MEDLDINLEQTVQSGTTAMIAAGGVLVLSALIVMIIIIAKRMRGRMLPLIIGLVNYSLFGFIFSNLVISLLTLLPGVEYAFEYNTNAYLIIYNLIVVVGFMLARTFTAKLIVSRYDRSGDVYLAGTGIALGESIVMYGLSAIYTYIYAAVIENSGLEVVITDMIDNGLTTDEIMTEYSTYISQLFDAPSFLWLMLGLSTILDIVLNVMLMVIVYGVHKKQVQDVWTYCAVLIQFVALMSFQIYNSSSVVSIIACFVVKLLIVGGVSFFVMKYISPNITYAKE